MALTAGQQDVIVRAYRVTLSPEPEVEFDPFTITASYAVDDPRLDGDKRDPYSEACRQEVHRIALKKERREHSVPADINYDLASFELVREFKIPKEAAK